MGGVVTIRMTIRVTLSNSAGKVDAFNASDLGAAREEIAQLLQLGLAAWHLQPGDTIKVEEIDKELRP